MLHLSQGKDDGNQLSPEKAAFPKR